MQLHPTIIRCLSGLVGEPCWGVRPGIQPCLTLEFGRPWLKVREPLQASPESSKAAREILARRDMRAVGERHLWTFTSDWSVQHNQVRIGCSEDGEQAIAEAAHRLDGQFVIAASCRESVNAVTLDFDQGSRLTLATVSDDSWILFLPREMALTVRGDGTFAYRRSNGDPAKNAWQPMWTSPLAS